MGLYDGLTSAEAEAKKAAGKINTPPPSAGKSKKQIFLTNICTYFNLIFFLIAIALLCVGAFNHLMFLPVILANIAIGIIQELRAKATLDKLHLINEQKIGVRRDGKDTYVPSSELVEGDLVFLSAGNQIPADAQILAGDVTVNESLITGESDEIRKTVGDELFSGSYVISGKCAVTLTKVGAESFAGNLTGSARKMKKRQPVGMMRSLKFLINIIGVTMIPIGALLVWRHYGVLGLSPKDTVTTTAAALLGMIPDGLFLLVSIALTLGVIRLSKKQVLVRQLSCIEALARVDVFCVDKTGTITEDKMNLEEVIPLGAGADESACRALLCDYVGAVDSDNNTVAALKEALGSGSFRAVRDTLPFSSVVKFGGVSFADGQNVVLGAPEVLIGAQYAPILAQASELASRGLRVLALGVCQCDLVKGQIPAGTVPLALVTLSNRIRPGAAETFSYFASQGVTIRVISGDNPATVSAVAKEAGIENADAYVDARTLDTPEKLAEAAEKYTVFGRVKPDQKRDLLRAMKAAGHTVAMTGDGVNDVLALKEADCSVAMASGSDVAQRVSDLVLLDSDFGAMPNVVLEGRRVINNIERSASLFLVKNIFSFLLAIITIIAAFEYPLTPAQLTLFNMLFIGFPSFVLALEPNKSRVTGKFLRNVLYRAAPAALSDLLLVLGAVLFSFAFPEIAPEISTIAVILMGTVGLQLLIRLCRPFNWLRYTLLSLIVVGFLLGLIFLPGLFSISPLSFGGALVLGVFMLLSVPVVTVLTKAEDKIADFVTKKWEAIRKKAQEGELFG